MNAIVEINLFSGLPNPRWRLDTPLVDHLVATVQHLQVLDVGFTAIAGYDQPLGLPRAGYRGFKVMLGGEKAVADFTVFHSLIWEDATGRVRRDASQQIEKALIVSIPEPVILEFFSGQSFAQATAPGQETSIQGIGTVPVGLECPGVPPFVGDHGPFHDLQQINNCYNYATNVVNTDHGRGAATPGNLTRKSHLTKAKLLNALVGDGLVNLGSSLPNECPGENKHYLAVVLRHDDDGNPSDFHCLRLGPDGTWSHKDGDDAVTNLDNKGHPMPDLKTARIHGNPQLVGFFAFSASNGGKIK